MAEGYLKRVEGPRGQFAQLLTRLPYDNALAIEEAFILERTPSKRADAILRNLLWEYQVENYLTGEPGGDIGEADPAMVADWRDEAVLLYVAWRKEAMPGPKGSTRKRVRSTPTGSPESSSDEAA